MYQIVCVFGAGPVGLLCMAVAKGNFIYYQIDTAILISETSDR